MQALIALLVVPLMLLNFLGGTASGIWLAVLGEWWAIAYGIAALFSHFLLAFVMMPALIFIGPASFLHAKGRMFLAFPFVLLSQVYTYGVITAWCLFVFYFFISRASHDAFWPLLIWSYGVALGPWMYMTQKEQQGGSGDASLMTTFFAQVAYVVIALVVIFGEASLEELAVVFGGVMLVGMLVQTSIAFALLRGSS